MDFQLKTGFVEFDNIIVSTTAAVCHRDTGGLHSASIFIRSKENRWLFISPTDSFINESISFDFRWTQLIALVNILLSRTFKRNWTFDSTRICLHVEQRLILESKRVQYNRATRDNDLLPSITLTLLLQSYDCLRHTFNSDNVQSLRYSFYDKHMIRRLLSRAWDIRHDGQLGRTQ